MSSYPFLVQLCLPPGRANHTGGSSGQLDGNHFTVMPMQSIGIMGALLSFRRNQPVDHVAHAALQPRRLGLQPVAICIRQPQSDRNAWLGRRRTPSTRSSAAELPAGFLLFFHGLIFYGIFQLTCLITDDSIHQSDTQVNVTCSRKPRRLPPAQRRRDNDDDQDAAICRASHHPG